MIQLWQALLVSSDVTGEAEDTVIASPPRHGSSHSTEGIIWSKAMGNVFNFTDNEPGPSAVFDLGNPVTGFVVIYNKLVDPTGLKPESLVPSTKVQVTINTHWHLFLTQLQNIFLQ